jgi:epoxyqueuosine reductase QueG
MQETIARLIREYVAAYPERVGAETRWEEPLVAFAAAGDELFASLRQKVSASHALPGDLLPEARTVIVYFIPFAERVITSNIPDTGCSREWAVAYIETNRLIADLNGYLHDELARLGYQSAVTPATHNFDPQKLISDWSHRHLAYIAGLGSFGLNNMLITAKGCCGRLGSLVTNLEIEPTARAEGENCLFRQRGLCGKCVDRCVKDALTVDGFDRHRCYAMCLENAERFTAIGLADVCGKCLVNVPCSRLNPGGKSR